MAVEFRDPTFENVLAVAANMRVDDAREIYATRFTDDPSAVACDVMACPGFAWTVYVDGVPTAAIGGRPMHPGVWTVWMFATDDFGRCGLSMTKFARRVMMPALIERRAHRVQCLSIDGHETAHRWLEMLGAKPAHRLQGFGRNREDFVLYEWSEEDHVPRRS